MRNTTILAAAVVVATSSLVAVAGNATAAQERKTASRDAVTISIERGRYIARIAGCNDCHTAGYAASGGMVPETEWLKGDVVGWRGDWGTTYPANLRLVLAQYSEEQWLQTAHSAQFRPPMPWFALRDMSETDLRSLYRFVRSLGAAGAPAPSYLPPGQTPSGPFVQFPTAPVAKAGHQ